MKGKVSLPCQIGGDTSKRVSQVGSERQKFNMRYLAQKKVEAYIKESKLGDSYGDKRNKEDRYRKRTYSKDRYKDDNGKAVKYRLRQSY